MTSYRLFPSTNGPASAVSFGPGNFIAGVAFTISGGGKWLEGYWWWVAPSGGLTAAVKCATWSAQSSGSGTVVAGSVVTSGTLASGQWNWIPLASPVQLAPGYDPNDSTNGSAYIAAIGVNGNFPDTLSMFNSGDVYAAGITNGPLVAFSGLTGSKKPPYSLGQGLFSVAGSDPSTTMPNQTDGSGDGGSNFWVDVQVTDTAPAAYNGSYRIWPNKADANNATLTDTTNNDNVAIEFRLSRACAINKVWYYSASGAGALGTAAAVYRIDGANAGTLMTLNASPSWSGAAASGWISCTMDGTVLPAGSYKVTVKGPATNWGPKDASTGYYNVGVGSAGIVNGPITVPKLSAASLAYNYNGNAGGTPPFSDGTTLAGQPTFAIGGSIAYPYLFAPVSTPVAGSTQNYWIDVEVTPVPDSQPVVPPPWQFLPAAAPGEPFTPWLPWPESAVPPALTVTAQAAVVTAGTIAAPAAVASAGAATILSAAPQPVPAASVSAAAASAAVSAPAAGAAPGALPAAAAITATALQPPAAIVTAPAPAIVSVIAPQASVSTNGATTASAAVAVAGAAAGAPVAAVTVSAPAAAVTATALPAVPWRTPEAPAAGAAALAPSVAVMASAGVAAVTARASAPAALSGANTVKGYSRGTAVTEPMQGAGGVSPGASSKSGVS